MKNNGQNELTAYPLLSNVPLSEEWQLIEFGSYLITTAFRLSLLVGSIIMSCIIAATGILEDREHHSFSPGADADGRNRPFHVFPATQ